ncbi:MAG: hypothetical protein IT378_20115, partial [Sandaracinaceae bacterium]|nr:hypothetical protein [Sandaracinaceae bacterium]
SIDPSELVSQLALAADRGAHRAPHPILWCVSPDDPRCAPAENPPSSRPIGSSSSGAAGTLADLAMPPAGSVEHALRADPGAPRDGSRDRLERPPRG